MCEYVCLLAYHFFVYVHFYVCVFCLSYATLSLSPSSEFTRFYLEILFSGFSLKMCRSCHVKLCSHVIIFG